MAYSPETGGKLENTHILLRDQFERAVLFADKLDQIGIELADEPDYIAAYQLNVQAAKHLEREYIHLFGDMSEKTWPILGPQTLAAGLTLGVMNDEQYRDRVIRVLKSREGLISPVDDIRSLEGEIRSQVVASNDSLVAQLEALNRFNTKTNERIASGDPAAPGFRLLGLGIFWGASKNKTTRGVIQQQVEREYVR